jgi:putative sigma-54 modulation protein
MRVTFLARCALVPGMRDYADRKLARLARHAGRLHEVRLVIEGDPGRKPPFTAELTAHMDHSHLAARVDADTQQEAVDRIVDKLDRQVVRRKDRVTEHKGHAPAGADPLAPRPRGVDEGPSESLRH